MMRGFDWGGKREEGGGGGLGWGEEVGGRKGGTVHSGGMWIALREGGELGVDGFWI